MTPTALRRLSAALVAWAVVAAACNGSEGGSTSTQQSTAASTAATAAPPEPSPAPLDSRLARPIPVDPDVTIGVLENGLTYYVRRNDRPGGRAQLRLVVDAGSALEDPDQSGAAHFLEHMLFNGTTRFRENELTRILESFGARFGPDVNAYTTFDETVYELGVPTADAAVLELGFDVLYEWASQATIRQNDVVNERGVVLEEWRLRDAGLDGRIAQLYEDVFLAGTGYADKAPIGDPAALRTTNADTLRRFYEDWYRPDLMAVVAVGDFDAAEVVELITDRFAGLEPAAPPRSRPVIPVPAATTGGLRVLADADLPTASVEVYYPGPASVSSTVADRRREWAELLATEMIATRLNDDITRGEAPYFSVAAVGFDFTRGLQLPGLVAAAPAAEIEATLTALVTEVGRARLHGFDTTEFRRTVDSWLASVEQFFAGRVSTQDVEHAARYVRHFLQGEPIPSAADQYDLDRQLLRELTADEVHTALMETIGSAEPTAVILGPDDGTVPAEDVLRGAFEAARAERPEPREEATAVGDTLLAPPEPVAPVTVEALPLDVTQLVYANGVTVQYLPTDISANEVVMGATSTGGLSRVADGDVAEALLVAEIVNRSGAGGFDPVALDSFLADEVVSLDAFIDVSREGFFGRSATEDLESLMQLVHLTMVAPRIDEAAARTVIGESRPFAESPEQFPELATTLEMIEQRWGDEPRYGVIVSTEDLDGYDTAAAAAVFVDRFGDAGDFVFSFAGDFDPAALRRLADTYLGTLPGTDRDDGWLDFQRDPPPGIIDETIAVGRSEQGFVTFLFSVEFARDPRLDILVELLNLIADVKLRDRIREALSATYSPFVAISAADEPDQIVETFLQVSGDPEGLDQIVTESLAVLKELADDGPGDAELATAKEQLTLQYELVSNEWWVDQMLFYASRPDESLADQLDSLRFIEKATVNDIRRVAAIAFPQDRYVLVRQVPAR